MLGHSANKLLEGEGLTFSVFVLEQRLARAHRTLRDPRLRDRTISAMAFDLGFNDLSYFIFCGKVQRNCDPVEWGFPQYFANPV